MSFSYIKKRTYTVPTVGTAKGKRACTYPRPQPSGWEQRLFLLLHELWNQSLTRNSLLLIFIFSLFLLRRLPPPPPRHDPWEEFCSLGPALHGGSFLFLVMTGWKLGSGKRNFPFGVLNCWAEQLGALGDSLALVIVFFFVPLFFALFSCQERVEEGE